MRNEERTEVLDRQPLGLKPLIGMGISDTAEDEQRRAQRTPKNEVARS